MKPKNISPPPPCTSPLQTPSLSQKFYLLSLTFVKLFPSLLVANTFVVNISFCIFLLHHTCFNIFISAVILPYPNEGSALALEIMLLFLFALIEAVRLFFGKACMIELKFRYWKVITQYSYSLMVEVNLVGKSGVNLITNCSACRLSKIRGPLMISQL